MNIHAEKTSFPSHTRTHNNNSYKHTYTHTHAHTHTYTHTHAQRPPKMILMKNISGRNSINFDTIQLYCKYFKWKVRVNSARERCSFLRNKIQLTAKKYRTLKF